MKIVFITIDFLGLVIDMLDMVFATGCKIKHIEV